MPTWFRSPANYEDAAGGIETEPIDGVPIPFAGAELILKLKQSLREKDTAAGVSSSN